MAVSSQAGLQALIHRVERPIVASYSRTISHPPIFGALTRKVNPYGAVAILARKLAVTQPNDQDKVDEVNDQIDRMLRRGKYREPDYTPTDWFGALAEAYLDGRVELSSQYEELTSPEDLWGSPEGANE